MARSQAIATSGPSATTPTARARRRRRRRPRLLVHLRRPSKLSTLQLADTQPFADPAGRFAFSHNGDLREIRDARRRFQARGPDPRPRRHRGRGALARGRLGRRCPTPAAALRELHETFGGQANLAVLGRRRHARVHYAGNTENPVFTFRLGRIGLASTALYSIDRSLFRFAAPGATERRLVRPRDRRALDRNGSPTSPDVTSDEPLGAS